MWKVLNHMMWISAPSHFCWTWLFFLHMFPQKVSLCKISVSSDAFPCNTCAFFILLSQQIFKLAFSAENNRHSPAKPKSHYIYSPHNCNTQKVKSEDLALQAYSGILMKVPHIDMSKYVFCFAFLFPFSHYAVNTNCILYSLVSWEMHFYHYRVTGGKFGI